MTLSKRFSFFIKGINKVIIERCGFKIILFKMDYYYIF